MRHRSFRVSAKAWPHIVAVAPTAISIKPEQEVQYEKLC